MPPIRATEKSLRAPEFPHIAASELSAAELQAVMSVSDRELIKGRTHALNEATQHLAEVMMNRSVKEALAGKNIERL